MPNLFVNLLALDVLAGNNGLNSIHTLGARGRTGGYLCYLPSSDVSLVYRFCPSNPSIADCCLHSGRWLARFGKRSARLESAPTQSTFTWGKFAHATVFTVVVRTCRRHRLRQPVSGPTPSLPLDGDVSTCDIRFSVLCSCSCKCQSCIL